MKKLIIVFLLIAVLVILAVLRLSNKNIFQNDASLVIESIENNSNIVSKTQLNNEYLIINLDNNNSSINSQSVETIEIPFKKLLEKENQNLLIHSDLKIALYSEDVAVSAKAFTLLNQLGISKLFIVESGEYENEIFQYKFRPDTTIRPE
ncbi:MAG: hypothetical protein HQ541_11940 [Mariniphaga sp.]|nr:hypothetical protein [Mariniphaga sp.]